MTQLDRLSFPFRLQRVASDVAQAAALGPERKLETGLKINGGGGGGGPRWENQSEIAVASTAARGRGCF